MFVIKTYCTHDEIFKVEYRSFNRKSHEINLSSYCKNMTHKRNTNPGVCAGVIYTQGN